MKGIEKNKKILAIKNAVRTLRLSQNQSIEVLMLNFCCDITNNNLHNRQP